MSLTFYILTKEGFQYALDSTMDVNFSLTGRATDNPVESGFVVADSYVNQNNKISMSGSISSTSFVGGANAGGLADASTTLSKTELFIKGLRALKESGNTFSVYFNKELPPLQDCVFEGLSFSQNPQRGVATGSEGYSASYSVQMTLKQIIKAEVTEDEVALSPIKSDESVADATQGKEDGSQNTGKVETLIENRIKQNVDIIDNRAQDLGS
jgi:hypothetical protein